MVAIAENLQTAGVTPKGVGQLNVRSRCVGSTDVR